MNDIGMNSVVTRVGSIRLPAFSGTRVMMLPFRLEAMRDSLSACVSRGWQDAVADLCKMAPAQRGVAYLTIDEAAIRRGTAHRRPGLHIDGAGSWGGAPWAQNGMITVASHVGCRAWRQEFASRSKAEGDCAHLAPECRRSAEIVLAPNTAYWCGPHAVHESLPLVATTARQFVRVSMPSDGPWFGGYTPNPDVPVEVPILPPRARFLRYRTTAR